MNRLTATLKTDLLNQWRNRLYAVGIGVGLLVAAVLAWLAPLSTMPQIAPSVVLAVVGGSTLMYVGAMVLFERDEGTLAALTVSPLRVSEYLGSKVATLATLSTLESLVMVGGALLGRSLVEPATAPNAAWFGLGVVSIAVLCVLAGIVLVVRYRSLNEFLLPMAAVAGLGQVPMFYFLGVFTSPLLLAVPTAAPAMLIRGAFTPLTAGELAYGVGYSALTIAVLAWWADAAFRAHVLTTERQQ